MKSFLNESTLEVTLLIFSLLGETSAVADLGGGMEGCIPPTSLKVTILAEKSASISNNSAPFRDASPPTSRNPKIPVKTFFFFFNFLETTRFWAKKTLDFPISAEKSLSNLVKTFFFFFFWRPPDFGRKKRLNFRFRPKNHSQFR